MQEYETEEQQIEAVKQWWKENSSSLFFGVAIGLAGIFGWQYYGEYSTERTQTASDLYTAISQQVRINNFSDVNKLEQLTTDFADTPYAALAALSVASYYFEKGEADEAITQLQWAQQHSENDEVRHIARVRLATVYLNQKQYENAEALLSQTYPEAFTARYEELKGDLYNAKGDTAQAIEAYDKAIASQTDTVTPWLRMKRDSLKDNG